MAMRKRSARRQAWRTSALGRPHCCWNDVAVVVSGGVTHATAGISSFRSRSVSGGATSSRARLTSAQSSSARNAAVSSTDTELGY
uniref:Uncharacterized protein n=1 Tax=Oryza meridionalis TaxID=40149 RepID=A0A0E0C3M5_9ORYZ